jgi:hypothetical protein
METKLICHTPWVLNEDGDDTSLVILKGDIIKPIEHEDGETLFEVIHGWMKGLVIPFNNKQLAEHFSLK